MGKFRYIYVISIKINGNGPPVYSNPRLIYFTEFTPLFITPLSVYAGPKSMIFTSHFVHFVTLNLSIFVTLLLYFSDSHEAVYLEEFSGS